MKVQFQFMNFYERYSKSFSKVIFESYSKNEKTKLLNFFFKKSSVFNTSFIFLLLTMTPGFLHKWRTSH